MADDTTSLPPQLAPFVSPTPHETPLFHDPHSGAPVVWPATGSGPTEVTVAIAGHVSPADQGAAVPFDGSWPSGFTPLLHAAEAVWEEYANVQFVNVADSDSAPADIRVGLADISQGLKPPPHLTFTHRQWRDTGGRTDFFTPDNRLVLEDPAATPVTALGNGDFRYAGLQATVFQGLVRGLGLMLGLDTSPTDPRSVAYPQAGYQNFWPDFADGYAVQALYGAAVSKPTLSPDDQTALDTLRGIHNPLVG